MEAGAGKRWGVVPLAFPAGTDLDDLFPLWQIAPYHRRGVQQDGDEELTASDSDPLGVYVWKTTADPFVGKITYLRVYSGMLSSDTRVWNQTKETEERFGNIHVMRGKNQLDVKNVHAGDIVAVPKGCAGVKDSANTRR